jgi:hypothetical protein
MQNNLWHCKNNYICMMSGGWSIERVLASVQCECHSRIDTGAATAARSTWGCLKLQKMVHDANRTVRLSVQHGQPRTVTTNARVWAQAGWQQQARTAAGYRKHEVHNKISCLHTKVGV